MESSYQNNTIRIRPYTEQDIRGFCDCVRASLTEFQKYLPWANEQFDENAARQWFEWAYYNWMTGRQYDFVIEDLASGRFIGGVGLLEVDPHRKEAKLGYWLMTEFTGRGLTTQAAQLCMQFAREQLKFKRLLIRISEDNTASHAIAKKLGAEFVEKEAHQEFHNDRWQDTLVYKLTL